eukprot:gene25181-biopygen15010
MGPEVGPAFQRWSRATSFFLLGVRLAGTVEVRAKVFVVFPHHHPPAVLGPLRALCRCGAAEIQPCNKSRGRGPDADRTRAAPFLPLWVGPCLSCGRGNTACAACARSAPGPRPVPSHFIARPAPGPRPLSFPPLMPDGSWTVAYVVKSTKVHWRQWIPKLIRTGMPVEVNQCDNVSGVPDAIFFMPDQSVPCPTRGHKTLARPWRGHGAGVARVIGNLGLGWRGHGAGMARAWRGRGVGVARACDPRPHQ